MSIRFFTDEKEIPISLEASWLGNDLNISISGGDKGHIGAVAVAQARPSLSDPMITSASTSVITICGHKEDRLACEIAEKAATEINGVVSVACGIHIGDATGEQIDAIISSVKQLLEQLIQHIRSSRYDSD